MPYERIEVKKLVRFVPSEASGIANALRAIAQEARELTSVVASLNGELDSDWEGQASTRFLAELAKQPPAGDSVAAWVEDEAAQVETTTVERWETTYEEHWIPD